MDRSSKLVPMQQRLNRPHLLLVPALILMVVLLSPDRSLAQMFSVDGGAERLGHSFNYSSLSVGWETGEFTFQGDPAAAGSDRFDFQEGMFRILFENPGIDMYFGLASGLTGADSNNVLSLGARIYNNFYLTGNERIRLMLPLQLQTDLLRVQAEGANNQFQQTAFQLGTGLGVQASLSGPVHFTAQMTPNYGFSNSQGAFIGGTLFSWQGKARLHFDRLLGRSGIVLGYDFQDRSYNIDADLFDYDYHSHRVTLGFTF